MSPPAQFGGVRLIEPLGEYTWRGQYGETPGIVKFAPPAPWHTPRSAFAGGQGLVPPFVPAVVHEARAWRATEPDRVLLDGEWPGRGLFVVLRAFEGGALRPAGADAVRRWLTDATAALGQLHAAGIVHRDIRPANVLDTPDGLVLIDLDCALFDGLGTPGPVGSRTWAAPELSLQPGSFASDIYGLGRVARWVFDGTLTDPTPTDCPYHALIDAMTDPDPAARPDLPTVADVIGLPRPPPARSVAVHPALYVPAVDLQVEAALLQGDPWAIVEAVDAMLFDRWRVAAIAGRCLADAARRGKTAWLVLAAVCGILAERSGGEVAGLHAWQAREALQRSGCAWAPAYDAIQRRLRGGGQALDTLCRQRRFASAEIMTLDSPEDGALLAWFRTPTEACLARLKDARGPLAERIAASQLLQTQWHQTAAVHARLSLPDAPERAMLACPVEHREALLTVLRRAGRAGPQIELLAALARNETALACVIARQAMNSGQCTWPAVACLARYGEPNDPLTREANALIDAEQPDRQTGASRIAAAMTAAPQSHWLLACLAALKVSPAEARARHVDALLGAGPHAHGVAPASPTAHPSAARPSS